MVSKIAWEGEILAVQPRIRLTRSFDERSYDYRYRERGPRRLAARTYATKCASCIWGAEMAVEMIVDHWKPSVRRYRRETFCYGPKSCPRYAAGPTRKVPGRRGMSWEEEDWVDEEATAHRGPVD